jgi:phosphate uptake regulator
MSRIPTLDTQIHRMKTLLRAMCDRVLVGLNVVVTHMDHPQEDELIKTIVLDSEVDNLEKEVDEAILQIFATQQPLAADLRLAYACASKPLPYQSQTIALMMNETRSLFMRSYLAMFEGDNLQIHDIHQADDAVDNFYRELFSFARNLLIQKNNPQDVEEALRIINISSKLEKIADLSCNWAEQIDFAHNGLARKKLQKRKHKILFFDHDGGRSACLVACMLQQQLGDLFDIGVATCSPINSQDYTDVHALLEKLKISPEVFPLANFRTVTWARALMCIQIGKFALSSWDRELVPYKTVFLNWTQQWLELRETDPAISKLQEKVTELSKILIRTKGR